MQQTVRVELGERAYDVVIGPDLLATAGARIAPFLSRKKVAIITDETVAGLHLDALRAGLATAGIEAGVLA
ncbi:MAG: 3-dehydroquinate synthase, partial [Paracoccaceae bacterium]